MTRYFWVKFHIDEWLIRCLDESGRWRDLNGTLCTNPPQVIGDEIKNPNVPKTTSVWYPIYESILKDTLFFGAANEQSLTSAMAFRSGTPKPIAVLEIVTDQSGKIVAQYFTPTV